MTSGCSFFDRIGEVRRLRSSVVSILGLALAFAADGKAQTGLPRIARAKPATTVLRPTDARDGIILEFQEGTGARMSSGQLVGTGIDWTALDGVLRAHGIKPSALERLFTRPEGDLDTERDRALSRPGC